MNKNLSYAESINEAFNFILKNFSESFVIGQGLWSPWYVGSTMRGLPEKFGKNRIIDSPVSEAAVTGIATGASLNDMKPIVVHPRMDFMLLAADAIINQSAKWKFMLGGANSPNVTIRSIINRGGEQGAQHSQSLYSMFANIPGVIVVLPSNPQDAFNLLVKSIITKSTVIYIDDRWLYSEIDKIKIDNKILKKNLLNEEPEIIQQGEDLTIISLGYGVKIIKEVSTMLNKKKIKSEVIDLRIINPLRPKKLINSAIKTKRVVVLDYGWSNCGIASEVVSQIAEKTDKDKVKIRYLKITLPSMPAPTNKINESEYYISSKEVLKKILKHFF